MRRGQRLKLRHSASNLRDSLKLAAPGLVESQTCVDRWKKDSDVCCPELRCSASSCARTTSCHLQSIFIIDSADIARQAMQRRHHALGRVRRLACLVAHWSASHRTLQRPDDMDPAHVVIVRVAAVEHERHPTPRCEIHFAGAEKSSRQQAGCTANCLHASDASAAALSTASHLHDDDNGSLHSVNA